MDAAISEIKQLAHVQQESQGGEEVTEQYVDLTARLSNARRTEKTLLDLLANRTGKLSDVLEVEQELARVREQIERMEAESKSLQNRVSFATLQVELHEEYEEELEMTPSLGRRLWNAVVEGFRIGGGQRGGPGAVPLERGAVPAALGADPFLARALRVAPGARGESTEVNPAFLKRSCGRGRREEKIHHGDTEAHREERHRTHRVQ